MYISDPNGRRRARPAPTQDPRFEPRQPMPTPPPATPTPPNIIPPTPIVPPPSPPPTPTPQTPGISENGMGYMIVRVTTASGAIPLEGALVTIREYGTGSGGDILYSMRTNSSGLTPRVSLSAPPRSKSLSPGNGKTYSSYNLQVSLEKYNPQQYINVPIFDGITAVQTADLVPLSENGETDRADPYNSGIFYESEGPRLNGGTKSSLN